MARSWAESFGARIGWLCGWLLVFTSFISSVAGSGSAHAQGLDAVAIDSIAQQAVAADAEQGVLRIFDLASREQVSAVALDWRPTAIALHGTLGLAVVAHRYDDRISLVDLRAGGSLATLTAGREPAGVAVDESRGLAVIVNEKDDSVTLIDLVNRVVYATIAVAEGPEKVAIDSASGMAVVSSEKSDRLTWIGLDARAVIGSLAVERPGALATNAAGNLLVAVEKRNRLLVVGLESRAVISEMAVGNSPVAIAVQAVSRQALVVNHKDDSLSLIDLRRGAVMGILRTDRNPIDVAIDAATNRAVVVGDAGSSPRVIELDRAIFSTPAPTGKDPLGVAIHRGLGLAVVANEKGDSVSLVSLSSGKTTATVAVGKSPQRIAIDEQRNLAVVTLKKDDALAFVDLGVPRLMGAVRVGPDPDGVALDPALGIAAVLNRKNDSVSIVGLDPRAVLHTVRVARDPGSVAFQPSAGLLWMTSETDGVVQVIDPIAGAVIETLSAPLKPVDIAISPSRRLAAVAGEKDGVLALIDVDSHQTIGQVGVGGNPRAVAIDDATDQAFVLRQDDMEAVVVDLATARVIDHAAVGKQAMDLAVDGFLRIGIVSNRGDDGITLLSLPDVRAPEITIDYPPQGLLTNLADVTVIGSLSRPATLTVGGQTVALGSDNRFSQTIGLREGSNVIAIIATSATGRQTSVDVTVHLDTVPPAVPDVGQIVSSPLEGGRVRISAAAGSIEAGIRVTVRNLRTGEAANGLADGAGALAIDIGGQTGDHYAITLSDDAGNASIETAFAPIALPPDPVVIAPTLAETALVSIADATAFLYTGPNAPQRAMTAGIIQAERVAVLRGRVLDRSRQPLPAVTISVTDHPEFGYTVSRPDGGFDLVVNGGRALVLRYERAGFLPVQRRIEAPWRDYRSLPDVVMVPYDAKVTVVDLTEGAPMQAVRGGLIVDEDGQRQATLLFPSGARAEMTLPDGGTQMLQAIHVRATEYSVGRSGVDAMPGDLPVTSGYTYAVELSIDEAVAAGANEVRFDRPVPVYVENFLQFAVGGTIPVGWYDAGRAAWIPADNGRVIRILAVGAGSASLDVEGSGDAASAEALSALGISDDERRQLAALYAPGQSLWRVTVRHFSPWDINWPVGPPKDARPPNVPKPRWDDKVEEPECKPGSIIECQNQVLGHRIAVTGTPYSLNYRSDRVPGRRAAYTLDIPLSSEALPASLLGIAVQIEIAGRLFQRNFAPLPNQTYRFTWDGLDTYGRVLQGVQPARVRVGYRYPAVYYKPSDFVRTFGRGGTTAMFNPARQDLTFWQEAGLEVGLLDSRVASLGGWMFDIQHVFHARGARLYRGDGSNHASEGVGPVIRAVAGTGNTVFNGDGHAATSSNLNTPTHVVAGPEGDFYVAEQARIRRVRTDGVAMVIAGDGQLGFAGDGGPATQARLRTPMGIALGPDGMVYVADSGNHRVRRISSTGVIETIAGTGVAGYNGDDIPAAAAQLNNPRRLAWGPDGFLYIADMGNHRIRRLSPDGVISTVAGTGAAGFSGDGGPAIAAQLYGPLDVAFGPDGALYVADRFNFRIRRVGIDGMIATVAGSGSPIPSGDGKPALQAGFIPWAVAVAPTGEIYLSDSGTRIRQVGLDGVITALVGNGIQGFTGDNGPALRGQINAAEAGIGVAPDGTLYLADQRSNRIRYIGVRVGQAAGELRIVSSDDGREHYVFDLSGRHLRTVDSTTGAIKWQFEYDAAGRLVAIVDGDGNRTAIGRGGAGEPAAIVAPGGYRTALVAGAEGYLAEIDTPMERTYRLQYAAGGLLTELSDPRGNVSRYQYDELGRLIRTANAAGGGWTLNRTAISDGYEIGLTSAEGRLQQYRVEHRAIGDQLYTHVRPDGSAGTVRLGDDGIRVLSNADGTQTSLRAAPDPRFGMDAAYFDQVTIQTPGGTTFAAKTQRTATLANPADLLSHRELHQTQTVNGRVFDNLYTSTTRTWLDTSPQGRTTSRTLDAAGRLVRMQNTGLLPMVYRYDTHGRLSALGRGDADNRLVRLSYDEQDNLVSMTDPLSRVQRFAYDAAGRMTRQTLADGREIGFDYDADGNLTAILTPGGHRHAFAYTPVNLTESYAAPDLATGSGVTRYDYDLDQQLTRIARPDGQSIALDYDNGGRLQRMKVPQGEYRYGYDVLTGQLAELIAPGEQTIAWTWDGFLPLSEQLAGPVSGTVTRTYDKDFQQTTLAVDGQAIAIEYDTDGLLVRAGDLELTRSAANGLIEATRLDRVATRLAYDAFGEPASQTVEFEGRTVAQFSYSADGAGRLAARTEAFDDATISDVYDYDAAGRLASVIRNGVVTTWSYDANGNRVGADGAIAAAYDAQDRLNRLGEVTYDYSPAGELRAKADAGQETRYEYDPLGNLRRVELPHGRSIDYVIDGRQRRVGKKVDGVVIQGLIYQDALNPVAELDGAGNVVARFVYADKPNVPSYMIRDGRRYRIVSDHLGSPRLVIDADSGEIAQRIDYDVWGRVIRDTRPGFQPFGFAGGLYDRDTGLVRFGARDYDPVTGRWTSKDPILFAGGDFNLYGYALGDPVNIADADGRIALNVVSGVIGAALGGYQAYRQGGSVAGGALFGFFSNLVMGPAVVNAAIGFLGNLASQTLDPCLNKFNWTAASTAGALGAWGIRDRLPWQPNLLSNTEIIGHEIGVQVIDNEITRIAGGIF